MNVILKGQVKAMIESWVKLGYANTQSEAIRLAIVIANKQLSEDQKVQRKIDWIEEQVKQGKRRELNSEEALGKYVKFLKE